MVVSTTLSASAEARRVLGMFQPLCIDNLKDGYRGRLA